MKKAITSIALVLVLIISISSTAFAAQTRASLYMTRYDAYIEAQGGGDIKVHFEVYATGTMDEIGARTITLQYSTNGSTWYHAQTFQSTNTTGIIKTNTNTCNSYVEYSGTSGLFYRAYVTVCAYRNGLGDSTQILAASQQA